MTDESMLYQKVDLLNGLFPNLDTEAEKDTCNAILAERARASSDTIALDVRELGLVTKAQIGHKRVAAFRG